LYAAGAPVQILLTDDDGPESLDLARLLERSGFRVTVASSSRGAMVKDLAVFDGIALGTQGGLEARAEHCRQLREEGYGGAILAVCVDGTEGERLLDAGADDFVTLPSGALELVVRFRAIVRRSSTHTGLRWGGLQLDQVHRILRVRGRSIALTACEWDLLVCLFEAAGRVVSRTTLRERLSRSKGCRGSNLVEVNLSRLRTKLWNDATLIETVRRAGYRLRR
jgi:two-component system OmpR family response regulator